MTTFDDVYYTASIIEFLGRKTRNSRKTIAEYFGIDGIDYLLETACVNHCLSMEQVSDELIEEYGIQEGIYDTVCECKYTVPSATKIGKVYARLVDTISESENQYGEKLYEVFTSSFSDAISDYNSSLFFAPADEIAFYYKTQYSIE